MIRRTIRDYQLFVEGGIEWNKENVLIVSVQTTQTDEDFAYANQELAQLVDTAMGEVVILLLLKNDGIVDDALVGKESGRNQPSCR